jgi:hypothetical protein
MQTKAVANIQTVLEVSASSASGISRLELINSHQQQLFYFVITSGIRRSYKSNSGMTPLVCSKKLGYLHHHLQVNQPILYHPNHLAHVHAMPNQLHPLPSSEASPRSPLCLVVRSSVQSAVVISQGKRWIRRRWLWDVSTDSV